MAVKLQAPENFCILPGDKSGLSSWGSVEEADGYVLDYYLTENPQVRIRRIYAQIPRKNILGLKNGIEYFGTVAAFQYGEDGQEVIGERTEPFYFIPISHILTAPKTVCLAEGESTYIEWEYQNTVPPVSITSSDTSVVSACDDGELTGYAPGDAEVTLTMDTGESFVVNVHVERDLSRDIVRKSTLMFTGDIMCPPKTQRMCSVGGYDFAPIFTKQVAELFDSADYVAGVLKTMCDDASPYESEQIRLSCGTPNLNSPSTFIDALKDAGFDCLFTATNHNSDCGLEGLRETRRHIFHSKMNHVGSLEDNPVTRVINGIRFAFINLSQLGSPMDEFMNDDSGHILGRYSEQYLEELIDIAHEKKADQIIVMMHWGYKNNRIVTAKQRMTAQYIAEAGADMILGSGPHVMQAYEEFSTSDGRVVPCMYSLGNFYSGMSELYENKVGTIAQLTVSEDSESYSCRLSLIPTIITSQDGMLVVTTVDPVVSADKQKAYEHLHSHYPEILFNSPELNTVSLQGSQIISNISKQLDCTCDYSPLSIDHLLEQRGEYIVLDLIDFVDAVNREEQLSEYMKLIAELYPGERTILLRHNFSEYGVLNDTISECDPATETNHIIYDMEEDFINVLHPIVIDISEYYLRDLSNPEILTYESGFFTHAARIIKSILTDNSRRFYYNDCDYRIWVERAIAYRFSMMSNPQVKRVMLNNYEAADILIAEKETYFLIEFTEQLLKLKELHVELPYVSTVLSNDPESELLIKAAKTIQKKREEEEW